MSDQGTGISIAWASSFLASILSLAYAGITREPVDLTTFGTTGGKEFTGSDLYDLGELQADIQFAPGTSPPIIANTNETATITWSDSGGTTWAATAFMRSYAPSAELERRNQATVFLRFSGDLTIV